MPYLAGLKERKHSSPRRCFGVVVVGSLEGPAKPVVGSLCVASALWITLCFPEQLQDKQTFWSQSRWSSSALDVDASALG